MAAVKLEEHPDYARLTAMAAELDARERTQTGTGEGRALYWHVVFVHPKCEAKAEESLRRSGFDVYRPTYRAFLTIKRKKLTPKGRVMESVRHEIHRNLFPRYLFVGMVGGLTCYDVRQTPHVEMILCDGERAPICLADAEINDLRAARDMGLFDEGLDHAAVFRARDHVRIAGNPMTGAMMDASANLSGRVDAVDEAARTAGVIVQLFGRDNLVMVPLDRLRHVA